MSRRRVVWCAAGLVAALTCAAPAHADTITEFPIDTVKADPASVAVDSIGLVWFAGGHETLTGEGEGSPRIAALDPRSGKVVANVAVPTRPLEVVFAGGAVWGSDIIGERLYRVDPQTKAMEAVQLPFAAQDGPGGMSWIGAGADGHTILITVNQGRVNQGGVFQVGAPASIVAFDTNTRTLRTVYTAPMDVLGLNDVSTAADGTIWTSYPRTTGSGETGSIQLTVVRIDAASGQVREFPAPPNFTGIFIGAGQHDDAWMGANGFGPNQGADESLVHVDAGSGRVDTTSMGPGFFGNPRGFLTARDGSLWFTADKVIGHVVGGRLSMVPIPTASAGAGDMVAAPDGRTLWFGEVDSGNIGRVDLSDDAPSVGSGATIARRGVTAMVTCHARCSGTARVRLGTARARKRAGSGRRATSRAVTIGSASFHFAAGTRPVAVRIAPKYRGVVRRSRNRNLSIVTALRDGTSRRTLRATIRLR